MKAIEIKDYLIGLFNKEGLEKMPEEYGFTDYSKGEITKLGYATNLTPETVKNAYENGVQIILTHHDAWGFVFGMKEACNELMREYGMASFFVHAPLDDADFGTNESLVNALGFKSSEKFGLYNDIYTYGRIVVIEPGTDFDALVARLENTLDEKVKHWKNNSNPIRRIAIATGGAMMTSDLKLAYDLGCDTYITGEKVLYTIQYARFTGMNLIIGSHTNTEVFGVKSLAELVGMRFSGISTVRVEESLDEWGLKN